MGARSRRKGHEFEREVAEAFREAGFTEARRGLGQADGGRKLPDVEGTPYWVECKCGARPNIADAFFQADHDSIDAGDQRVAVVISKRDRTEPMATLALADFLALAARYKASGG